MWLCLPAQKGQQDTWSPQWLPAAEAFVLVFLRGTGSQLGVWDTQACPVRHESSVVPMRQVYSHRACSSSSFSLLRSHFSISNIHLQYLGPFSKSPRLLPFGHCPKNSLKPMRFLSLPGWSRPCVPKVVLLRAVEPCTSVML